MKNPSRSTIASGNIFYSRAEDAEGKITNKDIKEYRTAFEKRRFNNFDEYYNICFSTWSTTLNREDFRKSTCTCPSFFKHYICKHIIGVAAMEKLVVIPCQAKSAPIGEKMNRGRPPAAKKALQRQDPVQPTTSAAITTTIVQVE